MEFCSFEMVQNLCKGYFKRLEKCLELNGGRIEPEHKKKSHSEIYEWEHPEELPALRVIYNDAQLKLHQKREIKRLNKEIKNLKKSYTSQIKKSKTVKKQFKKVDLKNMSLGRAFSVINGPQRIHDEMEEKIGEIKEKIAKISKMNLKE